MGVQVVGCWLWLSNRFVEDDERFPYKRAALAYSEELIDCMSDGLMQMCVPRPLNRLGCRPGSLLRKLPVPLQISLMAASLPACFLVLVQVGT